MRVVLDVNVWISALLWGGIPGQILRLARNQQIIIFVSDALLIELETTLRRVKFRQRLQERGHAVEYLMSVVKGFSQLCPGSSVDVPELRDPEDKTILAAAESARAEAIVTGDRDLLVLTEFNAIPIITSREFGDRYFPEILD